MSYRKSLVITGIRGVPASHGGFETFAENLSAFLVEKGWDVTVYCQESTSQYTEVFESEWNGVRRIHMPVKGNGAKATVIFDFLSVKHALKQSGLVLTLGYNTALFNALFRFKGKKNLINMDGIEWKRDKWAWYEKTWLYFNERIGCRIGHHLIADHPEIKRHLMSRVADNKITMIPYGARVVDEANESYLVKYGLDKRKYAILIARPEPENSILEIVKAFSSKSREHKLVVLGNYDNKNDYHADVLDSASSDVVFLGGIYDHNILDALRFFSCLYIHGHTVGGTNPSLIEALGSSQPVLAHDNKFNRWVAGDGAAFFKDQNECSDQLDRIFNSPSGLDEMSDFSRKRFDETFTWDSVLLQYEKLLLNWC